MGVEPTLTTGQGRPGQALQLAPQGLEPIQNRLHDAGTDNSVLSMASTA